MSVCLLTVLQELQVEKQKTGRVEAMMREQHAAMQKELGGMQAKTQSGYQELQAMQIKVSPRLFPIIVLRIFYFLFFERGNYTECFFSQVQDMNGVVNSTELQFQRPKIGVKQLEL